MSMPSNCSRATGRLKRRKMQMLTCSFFPSVLLPCDCYNKLLQIGWLKTTEIYFLTALEVISLKLKCGQSHSFSRVSRGESSLASFSFWQPQACSGLSPCRSIFPSVVTLPFPLLCLLLCVCLSYKDTHDSIQGYPDNPGLRPSLKILTLITSFAL